MFMNLDVFVKLAYVLYARVMHVWLLKSFFYSLTRLLI